MISVISPSEFPGSSGDSANYTEIIWGLVKKGYQVLLVCPTNHLGKAYDVKMRRNGVKVARIPIIPPRITDFGKKPLILLLLRLLLFYIASSLLLSLLFIRYRIRSVIIRHSILTMSMCLLFPFFGISSVADGELLRGTVKILPVSNATWRLIGICESSIVKKYSAFLIPNEAQRKNLVRLGFPRTRIFKREIGVDLGKIPIYDLMSIPRDTFGYFGSLEMWQNVECLVVSFLKVVQKYPAAKLFIIGNGSRKTHLKQLVKNTATRNIVFLDGVSREELWKKDFQLFRVAVVPRSSTIFAENSSIKIVEALASGKPTIASRVPGILTMVDDKDGVILVEPDDVNSMSSGILKVVNNDSLLYELSNRALKASERFSIDVQLVGLLKILGLH